MSINRKAIFDHHQKSLIFEMFKKQYRALDFVPNERIEFYYFKILNFRDPKVKT